MDRLLYVLGIGMMMGFVKMRLHLDEVTDGVRGTEGYLIISAFCIVVILCAMAVIWMRPKKKTTI